MTTKKKALETDKLIIEHLKLYLWVHRTTLYINKIFPKTDIYAPFTIDHIWDLLGIPKDNTVDFDCFDPWPDGCFCRDWLIDFEVDFLDTNFDELEMYRRMKIISSDFQKGGAE